MGLTQKLGTIPLAIQTDSSNNVGIGGAANASYKLAVTGASLFSSTLNVTGDLSLFSGGTANNFNTYALGVANTKYLVFGSPSAAQPSRMWSGGIGADSSENIFTGAYNNYIFGTGSSLTERMRITSGGQLLLGTSTTTSGISDRDLLTLGNSSSPSTAMIFSNGSSSIWGFVYNSAAKIVLGSSSNLTFETGTSYTERMRIRNDGFLKVKGNAANYISPNNNSHEISTNQASNYNTFLVSQTASDPYGLYIWYSGASPNNNMNEFLACADSTNAKAYIFANGNLANRNGSYGTISSDIRLKENIANATSKLNDILKLNVVNFNFKDDIDKKKQIGFIAQEFQDVFPSLVSIRDTRKYDEEGNLISGLEDALGVNVGMEFAILVKAIQELNAKVTALENK